MLKRIFDIIFSLIGIIALAPVLIPAAVAIKLEDGGPVFFMHERLGYRMRKFRVRKFRSMRVGAHKNDVGFTTSDDRRITRVGAALRRYKIDELPQLFNVLKGEMSFVGPRPEVEMFLNEYTEEQKRIFNCKPGITDYASLRYKDENEILAGAADRDEYYRKVILPDKISLGLKYMEERSLALDIKLILGTIKSIIKSQ